MTEDEAKKKWCPFKPQEELARQIEFSRPLPSGMGFGNSSGGVQTPKCRCIASDCMAWRWDRKQTPADTHQTWVDWDKGNHPKRRGHCGLAGAP